MSMFNTGDILETIEMFTQDNRPETFATTPTVSCPITVINAFIVSTLIFHIVKPCRKPDAAYPYSPSIADLAKFEHSFCKKEQMEAVKDILSAREN